MKEYSDVLCPNASTELVVVATLCMCVCVLLLLRVVAFSRRHLLEYVFAPDSQLPGVSLRRLFLPRVLLSPSVLITMSATRLKRRELSILITVHPTS